MNLAYIQYTDTVPAPHGAITIGPWVRVRPAYKEDVGLLEHELEHVAQFWAAVLAVLPWIATLFLLSSPSDLRSGFAVALGLILVVAFALRKRLTLMAEVDAYRVQLQYDKGNKWIFATFLSTRYGLDITTEAAIELLSD